MRGNVPDLDLPTPAEMRDTDGVTLTDLNHKRRHTYSNLLTAKPAKFRLATHLQCQQLESKTTTTCLAAGRNLESDLTDLYYEVCTCISQFVKGNGLQHPSHGCYWRAEANVDAIAFIIQRSVNTGSTKQIKPPWVQNPKMHCLDFCFLLCKSLT